LLGFGTCVSLATLLPSVIVLVLVVGAAAAAGARWWCRDTDGQEAALALRVRELRERLHIWPADGYFLSSEARPLLWRRSDCAVFIQKSYMVAAARLAQFRDDFDPKHLDAFCTCLQGEAQQRALRAWLLEVCGEILDPRASQRRKASVF
jgi:hypothetical protein